jgi:phosphoenolpyruvate synthase/pyruvate phosphate dikinase
MHIELLHQDSGTAHLGGKAASLRRMLQAGLPVPDGIVITTRAHETYSKGPLPHGFIIELLTAFDKLHATRVAVRSSALSEDSPNASWAGMFETYLNVRRDELIQRVLDCWAAAGSSRVKAYAAIAKQPIAVIIQKMVPSTMAGVMFTANPVTKSREELVIEAVRGLGEPLVQGEVTPDHYLLSRPAGESVAQDFVEDEPILRPSHLQELFVMALKAEAHFGFPVDIEWAYEGDTLYLLQARPVTNL